MPLGPAVWWGPVCRPGRRRASAGLTGGSSGVSPSPLAVPSGRRVKVMVLLLVIGDGWRHADEATDYPELMARNLLIEFIGGEPGEARRARRGDARSVRIGNYLCAGGGSGPPLRSPRTVMQCTYGGLNSGGKLI